MNRRAYPLSAAFQIPRMVKEACRSLHQKIRGRYARVPKPLDHLGSLSPEDRVPAVDRMRDLDELPKAGTSVETMDISVG